MRLVGPESEVLGVMRLYEARQKASDYGLDLVEISPNAEPPVCRIMDFGKFKFELKKKQAVAKKNQVRIKVKELKFRPGTDIGDYQVKLRNLMSFLEEGDKVKITVRFRGREIAHQELGMELLKRLEKDIGDAAIIEQMPKMEGRQMIMMLSAKPGATKKPKASEATTAQ